MSMTRIAQMCAERELVNTGGSGDHFRAIS
jgi:hypothetical protein